MFFLIDMDQRTQCVEQTVKRLFFVCADFIQQFVHPLDSRVVFALIANNKQGSNDLPVRLEMIVEHVHGSNSTTLQRLSIIELPCQVCPPFIPLPGHKGCVQRQPIGNSIIAFLQFIS